MRGHVRRRGKKWSIVLDVGTDEHGKRKQKWHSGFATRREAEAELTKLLGQIQTGTYVAPTRRTVGEFLTDEWLPAMRHTIRPLTLESYERACRNHLVPQLGDVPLQRHTAAQVNAAYATLLGRLAPGTVRQAHAVLHRGLDAAVRWATWSATQRTQQTRQRRRASASFAPGQPTNSHASTPRPMVSGCALCSYCWRRPAPVGTKRWAVDGKTLTSTRAAGRSDAPVWRAPGPWSSRSRRRPQGAVWWRSIRQPSG
jgi:hypothetical protein